MRHYETTYVLRPNIGEEQFTEIIDRTNNIITDDGGVILSVDRWGMKRLAYEIKKEVQGYYVYLSYAAPGTTIDELERIFRIDDRLLRFLTIKLNDEMDEAAIAEEKERLAEQAAEAEKEAEAEEAQEAVEDKAEEAAPAAEEAAPAAEETETPAEEE